MSEQPKFCKDCLWYASVDRTCLRSPRLNLVTGETGFYSADVIRGSAVEGDCGEEGKLWEPK